MYEGQDSHIGDENTKKNRALKDSRIRAREFGRSVFLESGAQEGDTVVVTLRRGRDPITKVDRKIEIIEGSLTEIQKNYFLLKVVGEEDSVEQYFFKNLVEIDIL